MKLDGRLLTLGTYYYLCISTYVIMFAQNMNWL